MNNNNKLFYCYSINLKNFLLSRGLRFSHSAKHYKTNKIFWVFEPSIMLSSCLNEWNLK